MQKIKNILTIIKWTILSAAIGLVGGLSSLLMAIIIKYFPEKNNIFLIPIIFFISGFFVDKIYELKGSGVDRVLKALNYNINLSWKIGILKTILSSLVIAVGGSCGKEGPCVQSSASFADEIHRMLKLKNRELVIITGIAGGLSGAFSAPLGTAILACEIIEKEDFRYVNLIPPMMASVFSYAVFYVITHKKHLFEYLPHYCFDPIDIFWFLFGAIFCSIIASFYIKTYKTISNYFDNITIPYAIKSLLGGIVVATIGYFLPEILGMGVILVKELFMIKFSLIFLLFLLIGKVLATSFTVGSGTPGGLVFPSICVGAISGALFSSIFALNPTPFIVLGMATALSASLNAPLGSAVLCTEMFGFDFAIPSSIGAVIGYQVTRFETVFKYVRF
ncbi:Cl- channel voltage-gated family protein [Methanocaldococcus villosus KIN24-T80]|uniref:Cl-channel voltage-gated family protein n=1 Tax=Methanocaldococcus villosus KIN24-T80 TaxID=1069083 RepID=N6V1U9_9EURY|nr:chloride channel protein [Methanocaldococcus villosus]ENN96268.1 Cl- channel voltage-gated family protein [Methanocaldococcus villosus KIN24-T80]